MNCIRLVPLLSILFIPALAQKKAAVAARQETPAQKSLSHDVYDSWKDITEREITTDGQFFVYGLQPQEGDGEVLIRHLKSGEEQRIPRGTGIALTYDARYAVFKIKPPLQLVKEARRARKKKEELPKDSLAIVEMGTGTIRKYPAVQNFKLPGKGGSWVAFLSETEPLQPDSASQVKTKKNIRKEGNENGYGLVVANLQSGTEKRFPFVKEYAFSENGRWLAFAATGNDSTLKAGVFVIDLEKDLLQNLYQGHPKQQFTNLVFAETNDRLAYIADLDTNAKTQIRLPRLFYWKAGQEEAQLAADESSQPGPEGWLVNGFFKPVFARDGSKLFFGCNPRPVVPDTTLLPEEIVNVEVWHWKDAALQTQQKVTLERDRKRHYLAVYHTGSGALVQLADPYWETTGLVDEGNAAYVLAKATQKYSHEHWDWNPKQDVAIINVGDGSRRIIGEKLEGRVEVSPLGNYVYWFSNPDSAWFAYDVRQQRRIQLTIPGNGRFTDETDDHPDYPRPYGVAGWTSDDASIVLYDRYDLWEFRPAAPAAAKRLTNGREHTRTYRYVPLDPEERSLLLNENTLLRTFDETTKQTGFSRLPLPGKPAVSLLEGDFRIGSLVMKAKHADRLVFTKETFREYPDWYVSGAGLQGVQQLTNANPQQQEYRWGSVELVAWKAGDGTALQGLLYKPDNFDPQKKYPLMVYYYERNSDNLHAHFAPKPIRSYINFSYFTSNGYLVFVPDIVYQIGYPGKSAYNCLVPGVLDLIGKGFVQEDRIGISGHSWGGYQTAYLIGQTNLFRAAEAGAPVANMTSAYGGIRWDSGLTRQAQYERTQSRIGGTLWEKPLEYIENSPLFHAPKVETPLLMMHNDDDGAVPWYQGIELYMALKRLGKPVWMLNYNGEKHGLGKRQNMKDFAIRLYQYFDYYLKDAPMPRWMAEGLPMLEKGINQRLEPAPPLQGVGEP